MTCQNYGKDIGFRVKAGTIWSIVDNTKGHDIIKYYNLPWRKKLPLPAGYTRWPILPKYTINVGGISKAHIEKAGW